MKNVHEVSKVVGEYRVVIGTMTITVKVVYLCHLPLGMQYMAIPSHSLLLGADHPYHPLRNHSSEEEALQDLVFEFAHRVEEDWGADHWIPFKE